MGFFRKCWVLWIGRFWVLGGVCDERYELFF